MNLFNNPSLSELSTLIENASGIKNNYNIIVDNDGEVLIDFSVDKPKELLDKYKFYFRGLHGKICNSRFAAKDLKYLNQLFKNLVYCWEHGINGLADYTKISRLQNKVIREEMNKTVLKNNSLIAPPFKHFISIAGHNFSHRMHHRK